MVVSMVVSLHVKEKHILLIGGGPVAVSRLMYARESGASVILVCPETECVPDLRAVMEDSTLPGQVIHLSRDFSLQTDLSEARRDESKADLSIDYDMVMCMTEDEALAEQIAQVCKSKRILVNLANFPALSDFTFMSQIRRGPVQIGISTNRHAPTLGNRIKTHIENCLPKGMQEAVEKVGLLRSKIRESDPAKRSSARRMEWLSQISQFWPIERLAALSDDQVTELLEEYPELPSSLSTSPLQSAQAHPASPAILQLISSTALLSTTTSALNLPGPTTVTQPGEIPSNPRFAHGCPGPCSRGHKNSTDEDNVAKRSVDSNSDSTKPRLLLVGAGPGDPNLLTVAARTAIADADLVLADKLVSPEILALVKCEIYIARKFPGNAPAAQRELNDRGLTALRAGKAVVRLKNGDPFVFGRGGEEIEFYEQHGFNCGIIPGISSAFAAPEVARVPLTHRKVADQLLIVTARVESGEIPSLPPYSQTRTTVLLMGVDTVEKVVDTLLRHSYPPELPVCVVERATMPGQRSIRATLQSIASKVRVHEITSPAVFIFGRVVGVLSPMEAGQV